MAEATRRRGRLLRAVGLTLAVAILALAGLAGWAALRPPLASLPAPDAATATLTRDAATVTADGDARLFRRVLLDSPRHGTIGVMLNLPDDPPPRPGEALPLIVVLGGIGTAADVIGIVPDVGRNVVMGYDWPVGDELRDVGSLLAHAPALQATTVAIPGEIATAIGWAAEQPYIDRERISLLGFSLGAIAAPAVQRLAERDGRPVGWTVLAYGGIGVGRLIASNPNVEPQWATPILGAVTDLALRPVEPAHHLPHLRGRFLIMNGRDDGLLPAASVIGLHRLTPQPHRVVLFDGDHMGMGPGQMTLLARIIATSRNWLITEGAVNDPDS